MSIGEEDRSISVDTVFAAYKKAIRGPDDKPARRTAPNLLMRRGLWRSTSIVAADPSPTVGRENVATIIARVVIGPAIDAANGKASMKTQVSMKMTNPETVAKMAVAMGHGEAAI